LWRPIRAQSRQKRAPHYYTAQYSKSDGGSGAPCGTAAVRRELIDKVVLVLAFHDRAPDEKIAIAKEMLRLLRRGGTLHVADYDKPAASGERAILMFARYFAGPAAAQPHIDGSWTEFLAKAGFSGVRRQSSHSVSVGRVSLVKARKL
jgi:hypothetical protein